jgi:hypothetical protein
MVSESFRKKFRSGRIATNCEENFRDEPQFSRRPSRKDGFTIRTSSLAIASRPDSPLIRPPATAKNLRLERYARTSSFFSTIRFSCRRTIGPVGLLESQEARWPFSRTQLKCGWSLSFNRQIGAYGHRRKGSPQFSHSRGTNPNRCCCATYTSRTPGIEIYRNKGRRPRPLDCTDDTTS